MSMQPPNAPDRIALVITKACTTSKCWVLGGKELVH